VVADETEDRMSNDPVLQAIQEFKDGRMFGHIVIEFRDGVPVLIEKKVATKLVQTYPNGANRGPQTEYRNQR
jgi:hypothetical protein